MGHGFHGYVKTEGNYVIYRMWDLQKISKNAVNLAPMKIMLSLGMVYRIGFTSISRIFLGLVKCSNNSNMGIFMALKQILIMHGYTVTMAKTGDISLLEP